MNVGMIPTSCDSSWIGLTRIFLLAKFQIPGLCTAVRLPCIGGIDMLLYESICMPPILLSGHSCCLQDGRKTHDGGRVLYWALHLTLP